MKIKTITMYSTSLRNSQRMVHFIEDSYTNKLELKKNYHSNSTPLTLPSFSTYAKKTYLNPLEQKNEILLDTKGKSGVYCWVNLLNGKCYIGSGVILNTRLIDYFQDWYKLNRGNLPIVRAILKYGMGNFALLILDFTEIEDTLNREQYWLDELKPEYNILTQAKNSKGYKHSPESIEKMRQKALGRKHSEEVRKAMSENRKGENSPLFGKTLSEETKAKMSETALNRTKLHRPGTFVEVLDLQTNHTVIYNSQRDAVKALGTHLSTLSRREKSGITKPFRDRYVITIKR
uniref:GIY-YIG endonuclease n=1 Tax=Coniophora puteana TaxID=80637 RepID=A0A896YT25_9AGAM